MLVGDNRRCVGRTAGHDGNRTGQPEHAAKYSGPKWCWRFPCKFSLLAHISSSISRSPLPKAQLADWRSRADVFIPDLTILPIADHARTKVHSRGGRRTNPLQSQSMSDHRLDESGRTPLPRRLGFAECVRPTFLRRARPRRRSARRRTHHLRECKLPKRRL